MGCCQAQPAGKAAVMGASRASGGKKGDFRDVYTVGEKLGEGTFGTVFDCTKKKGDSTVYAVKCLDHVSSWWGGMSKAAVTQWEGLAQEFEMLRRMQHVNVIRLHDVFVDRHFLYLVMDKYSNNLINAVLPVLQKGKSAMPSCTTGEICSQMLSGVKYLHDQNIVHRDVKADNYLVDTADFKAKKFKVVLTDLGTAVQLEDGVFLKEMLGTKQYWAPEVLARCYTHKVDVWAVGVVLWCMLTMKFPFNTAQETYTKKLTFRAEHMNRSQFELSNMLLERNPNGRVNCDEALKHVFIVESVEKHKRMVQKAEQGGGKDDAEDEKLGKAGTEDFGSETGFGDVAKVVPADVAERRRKNLMEADERFNKGERDTLTLEDKVSQQQSQPKPVDAGGGDDDLIAVDKQRVGESKQYSWWAEKRCLTKNVPDIGTKCTTRDAKNKEGEDDPAAEQAGDISLTEPSSVQELTDLLKTFAVDTTKFGQGQAKTLEGLFGEVNKQECRMVLRGDVVVRVVDLLALRVRTPSAKLLIESDQEFKDGRTRKVNRLPAVMRQAGGSGLETVISEIKRLLASELKTTMAVVQVDAKSLTQEQTSYQQDSQSYPGLTTVYRKTFFDATVNMSAAAPELKKLGLPAHGPFKTTADDGTSTSFKWVTEEELVRESIVVSVPQKTMPEFEGFKALKEGAWTEAKLTGVLQEHKIDTTKFGVGKARSIAQFVDETASGETKLFSDGSKLRRHLDILIVKIKNPIGAYLVETGHNFGRGQSTRKNLLPATKVRPFEDKVWAVRRLLGEVDIPYSSSKIIFGPMRIEKQVSPSYPGVITVYLKQVVEVQLMDIDVANLAGDDMGRNKWFTAQVGK